MSDLTVKRGDVGVTFSDTLTANGSPLEPGIDGATVTFLMQRRGSNASPIERDAEVVDGTACTVRYTAVEGDLDTAGFYMQEWQVELVTGEILTFPSGGYNTVHVLDDLGPDEGS